MFGLDKQSRLNKKLVAAVREGDVVLAGELLGKGASVEARGGSWDMTVLSIAAHKGHLAVLKLLLDKGANLESRDTDGETPLMNGVNGGFEKIVAELVQRGADKDAVNNKGKRASDNALEKGKTQLYEVLGIPVVTKPPAPVAPAAPAVTRTESVDEVVFFRPFGNRLLEETFNFAARERITLLRNGMDGPVEAMTREGFDIIGDKAALRHAFELYKAKGGKRTETEIFPDALGKPAVFPGRQP